jgi:hypothetical protein
MQLATFTVSTVGMSDLVETFAEVEPIRAVLGDADISAIGDGTVKGSIRTINTQLSSKAPIGFKFHNEGMGSVSLPNNAHELLIYAVYAGVIVPFYLKADYTGAFYEGTNSANWCGAKITLSATDVTLNSFYNNGVSVNAVICVFYR